MNYKTTLLVQYVYTWQAILDNDNEQPVNEAGDAAQTESFDNNRTQTTRNDKLNK